MTKTIEPGDAVVKTINILETSEPAEPFSTGWASPSPHARIMNAEVTNVHEEP